MNIHTKTRSISYPSLPRRQSSGEFRKRNNFRLIGEPLYTLLVPLLLGLEPRCFISVIVWIKKKKKGSHSPGSPWLFSSAPILQVLPRYHTAPCQRYPSVSGMPRVWSGNRTRLLRIDTLPATAPTPPASSVTLPWQGRGWRHSRLQGLTLSIRHNCCPSPYPRPIPKSF